MTDRLDPLQQMLFCARTQFGGVNGVALQATLMVGGDLAQLRGICGLLHPLLLLRRLSGRGLGLPTRLERGDLFVCMRVPFHEELCRGLQRLRQLVNKSNKQSNRKANREPLFTRQKQKFASAFLSHVSDGLTWLS